MSLSFSISIGELPSMFLSSEMGEGAIRFSHTMGI